MNENENAILRCENAQLREHVARLEKLVELMALTAPMLVESIKALKAENKSAKP
jgi:hypothetical protein